MTIDGIRRRLQTTDAQLPEHTEPRATRNSMSMERAIELGLFNGRAAKDLARYVRIQAQEASSQQLAQVGKVGAAPPSQIGSYGFNEWWSKIPLMEDEGYHHVKNDLGGPTNTGITLRTCQRLVPGCTVETLQNMTLSQAKALAYGLYKNTFRCDEINSVGVAVFVADIPWGGTSLDALTHALWSVGVQHTAAYDQPSGRLSNATLDAINKTNPREFLYAYFTQLRAVRATFGATSPNQSVHVDGWLRRLTTRYAQACILNGEPDVADGSTDGTPRRGTWY